MPASNSALNHFVVSDKQNSFVPESVSTARLLIDARQGDDLAINRLLDRHRSALDRMVRMRLDKKIQNRVGVSDVIQDVLVEANRRLARYLEAPPMPFSLWVRQIARDRIIDAHRRHRGSAKRSVDREKKLPDARGDDHPSFQLASLLSDNAAGPAEVAIQKELARKVEASIGLLDDTDSEIIILRHYEHLSNQEISQLLGLSEPAASMRYLRAIRRLKELIQRHDAASFGPN